MLKINRMKHLLQTSKVFSTAEKKKEAEYIAACKLAIESACEVIIQCCKSAKEVLRKIGVKEQELSKRLSNMIKFAETNGRYLFTFKGKTATVSKAVASWNQMNRLVGAAYLELFYAALKIQEASVDAFSLDIDNLSDDAKVLFAEAYKAYASGAAEAARVYMNLFKTNKLGFKGLGEYLALQGWNWDGAAHSRDGWRITSRIIDSEESIIIQRGGTTHYLGAYPASLSDIITLFRLLKIDLYGNV